MPTANEQEVVAAVTQLTANDTPPQPGTIEHAVGRRIRELRERSLNEATKNFARACHDGSADRDHFVSVITDPRRMERDTLAAISHGLAGKAVTGRDFHEFALHMDCAIGAVEYRIGIADVPEAHAEAARAFMAEQAAEIVLELHPDLPLPEPAHPDPAAAAGYDDLLQHRTEQFKKMGHTALARFLAETAATIRKRAGNGIYPDWFDPATHSVDPELAQLGYNALHNRPIPPEEPLEPTEAYLRNRIQAATIGLDQSDRRQRPHPAVMGKRFLAPYLDPELAKHFARHDAEDRDYCDDGPINFREWPTSRILHGEIRDPEEHLSTSYCRHVRGALMNRGIVEDIECSRPDLLAMSLRRNAFALRRLADFLHEHPAPLPDRGEPDGYQPVIRWNIGTVAAWQRLGVLTYGLTDNGDLLERIDRAGQYLADHFRPDDLIDPESAGHQYPFLQLPTVSPGADVDRPERVLIREALADLAEAPGVFPT